MAECKLKYKAIDDLKKKGAIDNNMRVISAIKFNELNQQYTQTARNKYGLQTPDLLFSTIIRERERVYPTATVRTDNPSSIIAVANDELFDELQVLYDTKKSTETKEQRPRNQHLKRINMSYLETVLQHLSQKFNVPYQIVNIPEDNRKGWVSVDASKEPTIYVNSAYATHDTPLHEYAHIFIKLIQITNKKLLSNLVKELMSTPEGKEELEQVKFFYPELSLNEQIEEAIVELIGRYAAKELDPKTGIHKIIKKIWDTIVEFINKSFNVNIFEIYPQTSIEQLGKLLANPNVRFFSAGYDVEGKKQEIRKMAQEKLVELEDEQKNLLRIELSNGSIVTYDGTPFYGDKKEFERFEKEATDFLNKLGQYIYGDNFLSTEMSFQNKQDIVNIIYSDFFIELLRKAESMINDPWVNSPNYSYSDPVSTVGLTKEFLFVMDRLFLSPASGLRNIRNHLIQNNIKSRAEISRALEMFIFPKINERLGHYLESIPRTIKLRLLGYASFINHIPLPNNWFKPSLPIPILRDNPLETYKTRLTEAINSQRERANNPETAEEYYSRELKFITKNGEDQIKVAATYDGSDIYISFFSSKYGVADANEGRFFEILPKVIENVAIMFSDVYYTTISFSPVSSATKRHIGTSLRLKGYNIFLRRLFGEFSILDENENLNSIPIPELFRNTYINLENRTLDQVNRDREGIYKPKKEKKKVNEEEKYWDIANMDFEEKNQIIESSGAKKGKRGYYYHLNEEQQEKFKKYTSRHPWKSIPGLSKKGFELSSNKDRTVYLKRVRGKTYLYIDLKMFKESDGVNLPYIYGRVRFPVDLVFHGDIKKYLDSLEKNKETPFISEQEAEIRKLLFKVKGGSAAKSANFYLFNVKNELFKLIQSLNEDITYEELNNPTEDTIDKIKSIVNFDKKVEELIEKYKQDIEKIDPDELRQSLIEVVAGNYDDDTVDGIWKLLNYLPDSMIRLLSIEFVRYETAFFQGDDFKNHRKIPISLSGIQGIRYGSSMSLAVKRMYDEGYLTDLDISEINRQIKKQAQRALKIRDNKFTKYEDLRKEVKKGQALEIALYGRYAEKDGETIPLIQVFMEFREEALNKVDENATRMNKGLTDIVSFIQKINHKQFNNLYTNVTLGIINRDDLKFPIDYTVIAGHEFGHAVDYYLNLTHPEIRNNIYNFINDLVSKEEFRDYLEKGLLTRGYSTSDRHEIGADVFAWMMTKGAGYDVSNSHIASLDKFFSDNAIMVEELFKYHMMHPAQRRDYVIHKDKQKREKVINKKQEKKTEIEKGSLLNTIRKIIKDFIDWINKTIGLKVYEVKEEETEEKDEKLENTLNLIKQHYNNNIEDYLGDWRTALDYEGKSEEEIDKIIEKEREKLLNAGTELQIVPTEEGKALERLLKGLENLLFVDRNFDPVLIMNSTANPFLQRSNLLNEENKKPELEVGSYSFSDFLSKGIGIMEGSDEAKLMFDAIKEHPYFKDTTIEVSDLFTDNQVVGQAFIAKNKIVIGKDGSVDTLVHEMMHLLTSRLFEVDRSKLSRREKIFVDEIERIIKSFDPNYEYLDSILGKGYKRHEYAKEIIAEIYTGSWFARDIRSRKLKIEKTVRIDKTLLQKVLDAIIRFFGGEVKEYMGTGEYQETTVMDAMHKVLMEHGYPSAGRLKVLSKTVPVKLLLEDPSLRKTATFAEGESSSNFSIEDFVKSLKETQDKSSLIDDGDPNNSYYVYEGKRVKNRVTDRVKLEGYKSSEFDEFRKEAGTGGHRDIQAIANRYIDENGFVRLDKNGELDPLPFNGISEITPNSTAIYKTLEQNFRERLKSYGDKLATTRFFTEIRVYDPKNDEMGTIDLLVVQADGKIDLFDWKFITLSSNQKDIPESKKKSWIIQMSQYKYILQKNYGVPRTNFRNTFMVPIGVQYESKVNKVTQKTNFSIKVVKIGNVNYKLEKSVPLIPLAVGEFKTSNERIDDLIAKLNAVVDSLRKKAKGKEDRYVDSDIIENYIVAIRKLQMQENFDDILSIAATTIKRIEKDLQEYSNKLKLDDPNLEQLIQDIDTDRLILKSFLDLDLTMSELYTEKEKKEKDKDGKTKADTVGRISIGAKILNDRFEKLNDILVEKIGERKGITNILKPEKILNWWGRTVRSFSQAGIKTAQVFYKYYQDAIQSASLAFSNSLNNLSDIETRVTELANSMGMNKIDLINKMLIENGNIISKFDDKYLSELKAALENPDKKVTRAFINKYIDLKAYNEWYEKRRKENFEYIDKQRWEEEDEANEKKKKYLKEQFDEKYDISKKDALTTANDRLKYFLNKNAHSEKYIAISEVESNKVLLDIYDHLMKLNTRASELGAIQYYQRHNFLPRVRKNIVDKYVQDGSGNFLSRVFNETVNDIRIHPDDPTFGAVNPITKQLENRIPVNYTYDIPAEERSTDLLKVMALWEKELLQYEWRTQLEDIAGLLTDVEKRKKMIATDSRGNAKWDKDKIVIVPKAEGADTNTEYLQKFVDYYIYGRKISGSRDIGFEVNRNQIAKKINGIFGTKVMNEDLPEEESNITISGTKMIQSANRFFQMKVLGLNLTTAVANLAGGTLNSLINSGTYFTKKDYLGSVVQVSSHSFTGEEGKKIAGLMNYFIPLLENQDYVKIDKLSVSKAAEYLNSDWLFSLQRFSDKMVSYPLLISLLKNTTVIDNELVNIPEYVRAKNGYLGRFKLSSSERDALENKIEKEIQEMKQSKSLIHLAEIKDDKIVIPGIERDSQTVYDLRNLTQQITKNVMGNSTAEDISQYRMSILGQSFMMFKNWIPRLADVRFGDLRYQVGTESWEYGRLRMMMKVVSTNLLGSFNNLYNIATANDKGIELIKKLYKKKLDEHIDQTGSAEDFISLEEFTELYYRAIRMAAKETAFWLSLVGMVFAAGAATPPDKEDPQARNAWKFSLRALDKIKDELGFWYNPESALDIIGAGGGAIFPSINLIRDGIKITRNSIVEMYAMTVGDEELQKKNKVAKYVFRSFPITKELMYYVAIANNELAKDLGIQITDHYRTR